MEALQKKPIKPAWNKRPTNQHHYLENVTAALNAIEQDGVKLVNIGELTHTPLESLLQANQWRTSSTLMFQSHKIGVLITNVIYNDIHIELCVILIKIFRL